MKKLIDISEKYLKPLKHISEFYETSVKFQMEYMIREKVKDFLIRYDSKILEDRNRVINEVHDLFKENSDMDKEMSFVCLADGLTDYELETDTHLYRLIVDSDTIIRKIPVGLIIFDKSPNESYIQLICTNKETKEKVELYHNSMHLAEEILDDNGVNRL